MDIGNGIAETRKLAWGCTEIAEATGLSVNFLRNEQRRGKLKARRFGRRAYWSQQKV
jgi:hypothetical protein